MNYKKQLKELSFIVNDELSNYIKVHDKIHYESETFKSTLKNLFGFGIPMVELLKEAETLVPAWESINERINEFKVSEYNNLSDGEKYFFDLLSSFVIALIKTVSCLVEKQKLLAEGSEKFGSLTWKDHQEKRRAYQDSIDDYMLVGLKLNDAKYIIFN